jgi:hypothetical protein
LNRSSISHIHNANNLRTQPTYASNLEEKVAKEEEELDDVYAAEEVLDGFRGTFSGQKPIFVELFP